MLFRSDEGMDPEAFEAAIHALEHKLLPDTVEKLLKEAEAE